MWTVLRERRFERFMVLLPPSTDSVTVARYVFDFLDESPLIFTFPFVIYGARSRLRGAFDTAGVVIAGWLATAGVLIVDCVARVG